MEGNVSELLTCVVARIDSSGGSREILSRLREIEVLLEKQSEKLDTMSSERRASHAFDHSETSPQSQMSVPITGMQPRVGVPFSPWPFLGLDGQSHLPPLTIPVKHKTSSTYLLGLPAMKALIGEYPSDLFFLLESRKPLPPELSFDTWPGPETPMSIDPSVASNLVASFFSSAHHNHPILDQHEFELIFSQFLKTGPDGSIASALCMVVFALGEVVASTPESHNFSQSPPGMHYIRYAMPTLITHSSWSFSSSLLLPQALVLASVYFAYIVRPLQSWRLIYSASTILQFKLSGYVQVAIMSKTVANQLKALMLERMDPTGERVSSVSSGHASSSNVTALQN